MRLAWKLEEDSTGQGTRAATGSWGRRESQSAPEPPGAADTLILTHRDLLQISGLQNYKRIRLRFFFKGTKFVVAYCSIHGKLT